MIRSIETHRNREQIARYCLQTLLDFQTPWGEWGESGYNQEERLKRVERERAIRQERLAKPNMFRTMLALETINWLAPNAFRHRTDLAFKWIDGKVKSGWFWMWMEEPATIDSDHALKEVRKIEDIRHTAQAVLATIKFKGLRYWTVSAIENLLKCQVRGGWPNNIGGPPRLFPTVYVTELLYALVDEQFQVQLSNLGRDDLCLGVRAAIERSHGWFLEENKNGLWGTCFGTATVLQRIGRFLLSDYPELVESATIRLCEIRDGFTWVDEEQRERVIREQTRLAITVRVVSALSSLVEHGFSIEPTVLTRPITYLVDEFQPDRIDAPDYAYLLRILCNEPAAVEAIRNDSCYDYLVANGKDADLPASRAEDLLSIWLTLAASRLWNLEPGMIRGIPAYSDVYEEEKLKIRLMLSKLSDITGKNDFAEVELLIQKSTDSETLLSSIEQLMGSRSQSRLKQAILVARRAGRSVYTEFLPRIVAELLKQ